LGLQIAGAFERLFDKPAILIPTLISFTGRTGIRRLGHAAARARAASRRFA
jgi:hypothetical protein